MSLPAARQIPDADLERVRVSLSGLIGLSRSAAHLSLHHSGIRADRSGNYLSSFRGRGMEFDESRPYAPGDDVRSLDWRVTARTGKVHTKLFREERERPVFLSVDVRNAMFFATRGVFKSVLAARLAALVAWSAAQRGDRVGGQLLGERASLEFKPAHGRGAVLRLLQKLTEAAPVPPGGATAGMDDALSRLSRHARPGSLVFVISDFRGLGEGGETSLIRLRRHCDVALALISDPLEESLPQRGCYRFGDGLREWLLEASPGAAHIHAARFAQRHDRVSALAKAHGMRFLACRTGDDALAVLRRSLHPKPMAG
jgi:uncharacterized protein (DUF58 family)